MNPNPLATASPPVVLGRPRFKDARAQAAADRSEILEAWRIACAGKPFDKVLADVEGSFAIGFQDAAGRVLLAVDKFAEKSLCYRLNGADIQFSTRADGLVEGAADIDLQAILDYLYFHVIPSPRTIYQGVFRLPPGHCAVFENGRLDVQRYWRPEFNEVPGVAFEELKAGFLARVNDAVAARAGVGKPACFLSGGTDSSTVAGMLSRQNLGRVSTYSIGFDAQGYDEMAFARIAARRFDTDHHEYYVTPDDLVRGMPMLAASFDQPFGNSSCLPAYYCARMARDDGVDRLLAGDGGDELFGGNSRYAKQRVFGLYGRVPRWLRRGLIEPMVAAPGAASVPLLRKAGSYIEQATLPMPDRLQLYNLVMRLGLDTVLTGPMRARVAPSLALELQREVWRQPGRCSDLNRELFYDWRFTLAESDLPKVNAACSLAGVDVAYPLLDDALLDFSLRLPTDHKLRGQRLRWFFKEALRGFLPDEIIEKKKHGFGLPFGVWTLRTPALLALTTDALQTLAQRGIVRADFVRVLLEQRLKEHAGYYGEMVWILTMLELWLRAKAPDLRVG